MSLRSSFVIRLKIISAFDSLHDFRKIGGILPFLHIITPYTRCLGDTHLNQFVEVKRPN